MMDRRSVVANGRVAATKMRGQVNAEQFSDGWPKQINAPLVDLLRAPGGKRERQLMMGDAITVYEERDGWAYVQARKDCFVGYVPIDALGDRSENTHWVAVPAGHVYSEPDIKSPEIGPLLFGSKLSCVSHQPGFHEIADGGYVPKPHLRPIDRRFSDPVTVAQLLFGAPYLWGGNSVRGIDCSGLVQTAHLACGVPCPGDSDQQEMTLGGYLEEDAAMQRGDILFWPGHVGLMVDEHTLIHANSFHMAVTYEPVEQAINRIAAKDNGNVTARKRLQNTIEDT